MRLTEFTSELKKRDGVIATFDKLIWGSLVEYVTVGRGKEMAVRFREGTEVMV